MTILGMFLPYAYSLSNMMTIVKEMLRRWSRDGMAESLSGPRGEWNWAEMML